jgi:hypothetical protein
MSVRITEGKVLSKDVKYWLNIPKYVVVNKWDRSLQPVRIWLPKPPKDLTKVDNIGLPIKERVFKHAVYPERLKQLEADIKNKFSSGEIKETYSDQRLIVLMWEHLERNYQSFTEEMDWIKRQTYHITYGYWCVIENDLTYIPPAHYFFLNSWTIDDVDVVEYRNRDREKFLHSEYILTTTHDANYIDTGHRTFLGEIYPKHRRDGATHKALALLYWIIFLQYLHNVKGGIQSFDKANALEHFKKKLVYSFKVMSFYLKPLWRGSDTPETVLKAESPQGLSYHRTLMSSITPATTADESFFDGWPIRAILVDEGGKTEMENVKGRHEVIKETLTTGGGSIIKGYVMMPSTVEDMVKKGGINYYNLLEQSKFYERKGKGAQTTSGMSRYYSTAFDGLEGHIDIFGKSVMFDYTKDDTWRVKNPRRKNPGIGYMGSITYINSYREDLKLSGTPSDKETLAKHKKRYPTEYSDCFTNLGGGVGFDTEAINSRLDDIRLLESEDRYLTTEGTFVWVINGVEYTVQDFISSEMYKKKGITDNATVRFKPKEDGQCFISYIPPRGLQSKCYKKDGKMYPNNPGQFITSLDPYTHYTKSEKGMLAEQKGTSNGGIATLWLRDYMLDPPNKEISEVESNRFVMTYNYRPETQEELLELGLMVSVFYGSLYFPENNIKDAVKHIYDRGYDGYLLYDINSDGTIKKYPGFNSKAESKENLFSLSNTHINNNVDRECHKDLIGEWGAIGGKEEMTLYDLFTAAGGCLLGARSLNIQDKKEEYSSSNTDVNVEEVYGFKNI